MADLISKKTRYEFQRYFGSQTLRQIEEAFDAADISLPEGYQHPASSMRRSLVNAYYGSIDWEKLPDVRKVLLVYENELSGLEARTAGYLETDVGKDWARGQIESLTKWLRKDGFEYREGRLVPVVKGLDLSAITETARALDIPEMRIQIARLQNSVEDDPALAIGTAKDLLETTCKTILDERRIAYAKDVRIPDLVRQTRTSLKLMPEDIGDSVPGAESVRKILGSLGVVAHGLAELRQLYGSGHGKTGKAKGLQPRHARLAVGAATTLAMFLMETHKARG